MTNTPNQRPGDEEIEVEKPTVEWLIDRIVTQHSPLIDFNVKRLLELIKYRETEAVTQRTINIWKNFEVEMTKRDLSSDVMPKGFRKMTDKEILLLSVAIGQLTAKELTDEGEGL